MNKIWKRLAFALMVMGGLSTPSMAQTKATLRIDAQTKHQHITGFGAFVCSPGFAYGHMSDSEINKVWSPTGTMRCNIMRIYIPFSQSTDLKAQESTWSQTVATAKKAKQMGLIVFASPWGQPSAWKTNNSSNASQDGTLGYLKEANWPDYAKYLEAYVQYMRRNGVELDAISIQNEPDWRATYAGCMWTADQISRFVKTYGRQISCKIMAPETLACSDQYANALNQSDVIDNFDIYGGHQYGGIQSAYKNLAKKGKEIWMTEYLINWCEVEGANRNFDFDKDFFNFFTAINTCMLGDFNAWIHYTGKRYYSFLGDGQYGTTKGAMTKRGYIMTHFSRLVTGSTRIDGSWSGSGMESSFYLSQTGDSVIALLSNSSQETVDVTVDLPFYTKKGEQHTTSKTANWTIKDVSPAEESCRPQIQVSPRSVTSVVFVRSRDRQASDMKGTTTRFDRIEDMKTTRSTFGVGYKISNKTKTFDADHPLLSSYSSTAYGWVALNNRYDQLVLHIKKVTTTNLMKSGGTKIRYINSAGKIITHNYGDIDLSRGQDFDVVFDLSPKTLTDGCQGIVAILSDNASSHLTVTFGDVYFRNADSYSASLTGAYVADDSNVIDFTGDGNCTSLNLAGVTDFPTSIAWLAGTNRVVYVGEESTLDADNIIKGTNAKSLVLSEEGGDFRPATAFTADAASLTIKVDGGRLVTLPFAATVPEGAKAYTMNDDQTWTAITDIPAHQPVFVQAQGDVTFRGAGEVSYQTSPLDATLRGAYVQTPLYTGDFILAQQDGQWGFSRLSATSTLAPFGVYANLPQVSATFVPLKLDLTDAILAPNTADSAAGAQYFDVLGRQISAGEAHQKGRLVIIRMANGTTRKVIMK